MYHSFKLSRRKMPYIDSFKQNVVFLPGFYGTQTLINYFFLLLMLCCTTPKCITIYNDMPIKCHALHKKWTVNYCRDPSVKSQFKTGIVLCMPPVSPAIIHLAGVAFVHPANEGWHYNVASSLIGWMHAQNHPCKMIQCNTILQIEVLWPSQNTRQTMNS